MYMCSKIKEQIDLCGVLRYRLGIKDIATVMQQNRLRWYGHVLRNDDEDLHA